MAESKAIPTICLASLTRRGMSSMKAAELWAELDAEEQAALVHASGDLVGEVLNAHANRMESDKAATNGTDAVRTSKES